VRQLLGHQAGLVAIEPPPTLADLADPAKLSPKIAAHAPLWSPGTRHGYHAVTLGWYEPELIRHVDPQGRTIGRFFDQEVAQPLDLDLYIGLPSHIERDGGNAFGTPGAGGSFGFADPVTGIGFGYVMNRMGLFRVSDPRELTLRQALFRDVLGARA
jgi:CubicO group peptidase (beta-lactamase class C family)